MQSFKNIYTWLLVEPRRLFVLALLLAVSGFVFLFSGLFGLLSVTSVRAIYGLGKVRSDPTIASLLPDFPTWWIPESLFAYFESVMLIVLGVLGVAEAKRIDRALTKI